MKLKKTKDKNTSLEIHPASAQQLLFLFFCFLDVNQLSRVPSAPKLRLLSIRGVYDRRIRPEVVPLRLVQSHGNFFSNVFFSINMDVLCCLVLRMANKMMSCLGKVENNSSKKVEGKVREGLSAKQTVGH